MFSKIQLHVKYFSLVILYSSKTVALVGNSLNPGLCNPINHPHRNWEGAKDIQFEFVLPHFNDQAIQFDHHNSILNPPSLNTCEEKGIMWPEHDLDSSLTGGEFPLGGSHDIWTNPSGFINMEGKTYESKMSYIEEYPQIVNIFQKPRGTIHDHVPSPDTAFTAVHLEEEFNRNLGSVSHYNSYFGSNPTSVDLVEYANTNWKGGRDVQFGSLLPQIQDLPNEVHSSYLEPNPTLLELVDYKNINWDSARDVPFGSLFSQIQEQKKEFHSSYIGQDPQLVGLVGYENMDWEDARDIQFRSTSPQIQDQQTGFGNITPYLISPSGYLHLNKDQEAFDKPENQSCSPPGSNIPSVDSLDHNDSQVHIQGSRFQSNASESHEIVRKKKVFNSMNAIDKDMTGIHCVTSSGTPLKQSAGGQESTNNFTGGPSYNVYDFPTSIDGGGSKELIDTQFHLKPCFEKQFGSRKIMGNDNKCVNDLDTSLPNTSATFVPDVEVRTHDSMTQLSNSNYPKKSGGPEADVLFFELVENVGLRNLEVSTGNTPLAVTQHTKKLSHSKMFRLLRSQGKSAVLNKPQISKSIKNYFASLEKDVDNYDGDNSSVSAEIRHKMKWAIDRAKRDVVMVFLGSLYIMRHTDSHTINKKPTLDQGWVFIRNFLGVWRIDSIPELMNLLISGHQEKDSVWSLNTHLLHYFLNLSWNTLPKLSFNWSLIEMVYESYSSESLNNVVDVDWQGFKNVCVKIHSYQTENGTPYKQSTKKITVESDRNGDFESSTPSEPIQNLEDKFKRDFIRGRIRRFLIRQGNIQIRKEISLFDSISWFTRDLETKLDSYLHSMFPHFKSVSELGFLDENETAKSKKFLEHEQSIKNGIRLVSHAIIPGFMGILTVVCRYQGTHNYISQVLEHGWGFLRQYLKQWGELDMTVPEIESLFCGKKECRSTLGSSWLDCRYALRYTLSSRKRAYLPYTGVFFLTQKWYDSFTEQERLGKIKSSFNILPFEKSDLDEVFWTKYSGQPKRQRREDITEHPTHTPIKRCKNK